MTLLEALSQGTGEALAYLDAYVTQQAAVIDGLAAVAKEQSGMVEVLVDLIAHTDGPCPHPKPCKQPCIESSDGYGVCIRSWAQAKVRDQ